jgi:hypothetical protein
VSRQAAPVEELICDTLFRAAETPKLASLGNGDTDDPTRELNEQLAWDQGLLDRLDDKVAQELISEPAAKRNRAAIEKRMEETRARRDRLQHGRVVAHIPANLRQVWPMLTLERQRAILAAVIERIEIHPQSSRSSGSFDPEAIKAFWRA